MGATYTLEIEELIRLDFMMMKKEIEGKIIASSMILMT